MQPINEPFDSLLEKIRNQQILLPDFQRRFVWDKEEKQASLIASVLAKMPIGSVLMLTVKADEYAYRKIGCKTRKRADELGISGEVNALLDGQQRLTVLANAFSNIVFDMAVQASELIQQNSLKRRFFLRLPKYRDANGKRKDEDYFKVGKLMPFEHPTTMEPDFLSDEIVDMIKIIPFKAGDETSYNPFQHNSPISALVDFCTSGEEYLIPLYLIAGSPKNQSHLMSIVERISDSVQLDILQEFDALDEEEKILFAEDILTEYALTSCENIRDRESFKEALAKQGREWENNIIAYLRSCLDDIQLHQLIVNNRRRDRAINIYENLNKGGISLGTFELIMAKYAGVSKENYYDVVLNNMKQVRDYSENVFSDKIRRDDAICGIIKSGEYIATVELGCINMNEDTIVPAYIDAYLNIMSLYAHVHDFDTSKIRLDLIKKNKIMDVSARDLHVYSNDVVEAMDLALFFLQMRCGVRNIKDINYKLMLVVISYILLNQSYRNNSRTYDYLEAWYWSSIFSGYFNVDQNINAINSIVNLIESFESNYSADWIKNTLAKNMFKANNFSNKDFLLYKTEGPTCPKEFLRDVICQFFLAQTYNGVIDEKIKMTPFIKEKLEKHHVIPLGSIVAPRAKLRKGEESKRRDNAYFLNSPINFIYITEDENWAISDSLLSDYVGSINSSAVKNFLGLNCDLDTSTEESCRNVLESRYEHLVGSIERHIDLLVPQIS